MPITTPQGTLDFKKVDRITFVGASSNTVIDTTTGSLGVGVGVGGPTSNLHVVGNTRLEGDINMLHTSNTASIKLNSNVVTEFPRSKKLIKYPRVALTSASDNAYENGYKVTHSNQHSSYKAWEAFDHTGDVIGWYSTEGAAVAYNGTTRPGLYSGNTRLATETEEGEWIGLELPEAIKLQSVRMTSQSYSSTGNAVDEFIIYAKKQSGDVWTSLGLFTGVAGAQNSAAGVTVNVDAIDYYKFFNLVVTKRHDVATPNLYGIAIRELEYYGTPEYDPEADGVDVVVKSVPNVPNTDWLEVYYDAKDLVDGAVTTVNDLKPVGTANNGVANGNLSVSDGAFTFDGSGDYIESLNITSLRENQILSTSVWVKFTSWNNGNVDLVFSLGDRTGGTGKEYGLAAYHSGTSAPTNGLYVSIYGYDAIKSEVIPDLNKWYHFVTTHDGSTHQIFINGVLVKSGVTGGNVNLPTSGCDLVLGGDTSTSRSQFMNGKIANFRLFNRALTSDEIWQLYAYQKEYFGHGDLGMTLKAGRLGIGTSEPRAALDVRGDVILTGNFSQIITGDGRVPIMGRISNTFLTTSPSILISDLPENVDIDRMKTAAYGAIVMMSGDNISSAGKRTPGKYMGFGEVNQSSTYIELAYGFYDGGYTKIVGLRYDIGSSSKSITVKQTFAQYYQGNTTRYDNVSWTTQGSTPGSSTYGVKDLTIFY